MFRRWLVRPAHPTEAVIFGSAHLYVAEQAIIRAGEVDDLGTVLYGGAQAQLHFFRNLVAVLLRPSVA